jgi:hypothetical protein
MLLHHLGVSFSGDVEELVAMVFLGEVAVADVVTSLGIFVLCLRFRLDFDFSVDVEERWRILYRGLVSGAAVPALVLLRAGASSSPAGKVRGVAPADVLLSSPRFRSADDYCGASTRLVLYSTEQAAQWLFLSLICRRISGETTVWKVAAADWARKVPGSCCNFLVLQGLFCKSGQLSSFWLYPMFI